MWAKAGGAAFGAVTVGLSAVEAGVFMVPLLAIAGTVLGLIVQIRNARTQTEPTILKIGHEALIEANATLLRERDEARENRDYWRDRATRCEAARES